MRIGKLELKPQTAHEQYSFGDENGYRFDVRANLDDEWGWQGSLSLRTFGCKTPEDAVIELRTAAKKFLELTEETA